MLEVLIRTCRLGPAVFLCNPEVLAVATPASLRWSRECKEFFLLPQWTSAIAAAHAFVSSQDILQHDAAAVVGSSVLEGGGIPHSSSTSCRQHAQQQRATRWLGQVNSGNNSNSNFFLAASWTRSTTPLAGSRTGDQNLDAGPVVPTLYRRCRRKAGATCIEGKVAQGARKDAVIQRNVILEKLFFYMVPRPSGCIHSTWRVGEDAGRALKGCRTSRSLWDWRVWRPASLLRLQESLGSSSS